MDNLSRRMRLCAGVSLSALILVLSTGGSANAQLADDAKLKALQAQIDQLQRTVNELKAAQSQTANEAKAAKKQASEAEAHAANAKATAADAHAKSHKAPAILGLGDIDSNGHRFLEKKPGKDLTFYTPGGEITAYGQLDVRSMVRQKMPSRVRLLRTQTVMLMGRSEISAGCQTSRPTFLIWASAASSVSPCMTLTSSISLKLGSTFR